MKIESPPKRWRQELVYLETEHLAALQASKLLALDVQNKYVMLRR